MLGSRDIVLNETDKLLTLTVLSSGEKDNDKLNKYAPKFIK